MVTDEMLLIAQKAWEEAQIQGPQPALRAALTAALEGMVVVPSDCHKWSHHPIEMPVNAKGHGPASIPDAVRIQYEVWDQLYLSHALYDNLPDAINDAMIRTAKE